MIHDIVLAVHITFGVLGVLLGPVVVWQAAGHRTTRLADGFHGSVAVVCITAIGLAALDFSALWWFVPISLGSYALVVWAFLANRSRTPGWAARAVRGYGGGFIALWTAILVVSAGASVITWVLPTVIGTPLVEVLAMRANKSAAAP